MVNHGEPSFSEMARIGGIAHFQTPKYTQISHSWLDIPFNPIQSYQELQILFRSQILARLYPTVDGAAKSCTLDGCNIPAKKNVLETFLVANCCRISESIVIWNGSVS